jgi:hypothetical protein
MSRTIRLWAACALAAVGVAGLVFLSACNSTSSSPAGSSGLLKVLATDSPSDDWSVVQVQLKSISLRNANAQSWAQVWAADPNNPTNVNLVDLSGVAQILGSATISAGSYDRLEIVVNTDPTTMQIVADDGTTYSAPNITVVDPTGTGEIKVDISPALTVSGNSTNVLQVDFDLAHPLSIFVLNGKVIVNLQIRHKAVPANLREFQFARSIGNVTSADTTNNTSFNLTTLDGTALTFGVDSSTIYTDVDANAAGTFAGLASLVGSTSKGALVASNMNSDGSLYARRVWYGTITSLPQFTPEGLIRRVGDNWIKVLEKNTNTTTMNNWTWVPVTVTVNDATTWTFQGTVSMGTGTGLLQYMRRGFRVSVVYVDASVTPKVAQSIDVESAHDEGAIRSVTATGITFGGAGYCAAWVSSLSGTSAQNYGHEWPFSTITGYAFSWWFFGLPSSASTSIQDFTDTVNQANSANLRVLAGVDLVWDQTNNLWAVENCILEPEQLPLPTEITTGYTTASGAMGVSTFSWTNNALPTVMTVYLDTTGDLQTVVGSVVWNSTTRILTTTFPVDPSQWQSLLTPSLFGVMVWVRPVKAADGTFSWHAYTVIAFQITS